MSKSRPDALETTADRRFLDDFDSAVFIPEVATLFGNLDPANFAGDPTTEEILLLDNVDLDGKEIERYVKPAHQILRISVALVLAQGDGTDTDKYLGEVSAFSNRRATTRQILGAIINAVPDIATRVAETRETASKVIPAFQREIEVDEQKAFQAARLMAADPRSDNPNGHNRDEEALALLWTMQGRLDPRYDQPNAVILKLKDRQLDSFIAANLLLGSVVNEHAEAGSVRRETSQLLKHMLELYAAASDEDFASAAAKLSRAPAVEKWQPEAQEALVESRQAYSEQIKAGLERRVSFLTKQLLLLPNPSANELKRRVAEIDGMVTKSDTSKRPTKDQRAARAMKTSIERLRDPSGNTSSAASSETTKLPTRRKLYFGNPKDKKDVDTDAKGRNPFAQYLEHYIGDEELKTDVANVKKFLRTYRTERGGVKGVHQVGGKFASNGSPLLELDPTAVHGLPLTSPNGQKMRVIFFFTSQDAIVISGVHAAKNLKTRLRNMVSGGVSSKER